MDRNLFYIVVILIGTYFGCILFGILGINDRLEEQNSILRNLVVSVQNQADAIKEQNKILSYNPMEENK